MKATINVDDMNVFITVVRNESFTKAAEVLGSNKAHVSRVVSRLEKGMNIQLLRRSTRRLTITEAGREFFERAVSILTALEETESFMSSSQVEPQGTLKVTAGLEFGLLRVNGWISQYLKRYPQVQIHADISNRLVDVIHEGVDVAIRVGMLPDSDLSVRKLGEITYGFYASPSYLRKNKKPSSPKDLSNRDFIHFSSKFQKKCSLKLINGMEVMDLEVKPILLVNNNMAVLSNLIDGLGIGLIPDLLAHPYVAQKKLVRVLPKWTKPPMPVHALFSSSRYMAPKVRHFIDLAKENF